MTEKIISLQNNHFSKIEIGKMVVPILILYIISLFIFVDHPQLIIISETFLLLFLGTAFFKILLRNQVHIDFIIVTMLAFLLACLLSFFWSIEPSEVVRGFLQLLQLFFLLFIIAQVLNSYKNINGVILAIGFSGIVLFLYGLLVYGFGGIFHAILTGERLGAEISQENTMGRLASLSALVFFVHGIERKKYINFGYMIFPIIIILASGSRTAMAILILGMLMAIIAKSDKKKWFRFFILLPITSIVFFGIFQLSVFDSIKQRYHNLYLALLGNDKDGSMRINMVKWGWEWFSQKPIGGYGIGNYKYLLYERIGWATYSHNNFIEILVGVGVLGFFIYYSVYLYIFINLSHLIRNNTPHALTLFTLFFSWFIAEIGAVNYYDKVTYVLMGICVAFIRISKEKKYKKNPNI